MIEILSLNPIYSDDEVLGIDKIGVTLKNTTKKGEDILINLIIREKDGQDIFAQDLDLFIGAGKVNEFIIPLDITISGSFPCEIKGVVQSKGKIVFESIWFDLIETEDKVEETVPYKKTEFDKEEDTETELVSEEDEKTKETPVKQEFKDEEKTEIMDEYVSPEDDPEITNLSSSWGVLFEDGKNERYEAKVESDITPPKKEEKKPKKKQKTKKEEIEDAFEQEILSNSKEEKEDKAQEITQPVVAGIEVTSTVEIPEKKEKEPIKKEEEVNKDEEKDIVEVELPVSNDFADDNTPTTQTEGIDLNLKDTVTKEQPIEIELIKPDIKKGVEIPLEEERKEEEKISVPKKEFKSAFETKKIDDAFGNKKDEITLTETLTETIKEEPVKKEKTKKKKKTPVFAFILIPIIIVVVIYFSVLKDKLPEIPKKDIVLEKETEKEVEKKEEKTSVSADMDLDDLLKTEKDEMISSLITDITSHRIIVETDPLSLDKIDSIVDIIEKYEGEYTQIGNDFKIIFNANDDRRSKEIQKTLQSRKINSQIKK